jgi:ribulose kinase
VEGATLGLGYGLTRFRELGMDPTEIRLTGGGSQSKTWRQIAADVFNAEVVTLATAEGAALGAAVQAAHALLKRDGKAKSIEELTSRLVRRQRDRRGSSRSDRHRSHRRTGRMRCRRSGVASPASFMNARSAPTRLNPPATRLSSEGGALRPSGRLGRAHEVDLLP